MRTNMLSRPGRCITAIGIARRGALKGESSRHVQRVVAMRMDCDQDAVWIRVEQSGGACHTGRHSCFYRAVTSADGSVKLSLIDADKVFDPAKVYR